MTTSTRFGQTAVGEIERHRRREAVSRPDEAGASAGSVVFVVDDDPSIRDALRRLITSVGFKVEMFPNARAFLDARRPEIPGCLVLTCASPD